jgi:hypothetical protein
MARRSTNHFFIPCSILSLWFSFASFPWLAGVCRAQEPQSAANSDKPATYPRGKKLILTDGTYQVVREYQRNGERVRYYSLERGAWEELPASMVDWSATAKAEAEMEKESTALVEKVHKQEEGRRMDNVTDIDASLRVGDGAFLPSGEGMFLVEGKSVRILDQAGSEVRLDKKRVIEQVLSPVPIVPGKENIVLQGAHAAVRLKTDRPEFYLREPPPDPDGTSKIKKSTKPNESGPDVALIQAKVSRSTRQLESIDSLFGQTVNEKVKEISIQRWEIAPNVYRFTLSQPLPPGEYVLAEVLEDGLNLFVWDFGVDGGGGKASK